MGGSVVVDQASPLQRYGWYEWLCHSHFSFLTGASHPHEYIERGQELGYRGMAVTDLDGVYGLVRGHRALKALGPRVGREGFQLIHGLELHLAAEHRQPLLWRDTLALVAMSREGYAQLCHLATKAHERGKTGAYLSREELLAEKVTELVAIQPMRGLVRRGMALEALAAIQGPMAEHFRGRFYFAISRHLHPAEDAWIAPTLALARRLGRDCLLSQDPFFHAPSRRELGDLVQAVRVSRPLAAAAAELFPSGERCLRELGTLAARYGGLPVYGSALAAGRALAAAVSFDMGELRYRYPREMIPEGLSAMEFLSRLTWEAAHARHGSLLPDKVAALLHHELALLERLEFADYFLTVWDIVRWARGRGILCQGRGSAANSAVCFVLGITAVDPELFDLLFERFVSVERGDPPDIDVDFEHERREEVIQYIYERYGRGRAAMLANVITFRSRGAVRAVGQALGVPPSLLSLAARRLDERVEMDDERIPGVLKAIEAESGAAATIPWELWRQLAVALKGVPRHLGIHSGGFMIADEPLCRLVAQEPATMAGRSVIQWSKEDVEALGFFKIDILALGMLTALRKGMTAIAAHGGPTLELATIPQEDPATYAMIQRADTVGTFQIESRAQMSMLPRLRPKTFYDLVVEIAIIRPGPIQGGMIHPYLRRRDGLEPVSYPDPRLKTILARTLGVPLFQEQVMRIAMAVGDFTPGEANELRRHMGAWSLKGDMGPWLGRLATAMKRQGLTEEFTSSLLAQLQGFAHYGFPESHAVSFALLAYASAYLKCHFPAAFFLALLNSQPMGFYAPYSLVQAAQAAGVQVLPICANHSHWDATLEAGSHGEASPKVGPLRLGLRLVTGLRRAGAEALMAARAAAGGRFATWHSALAGRPLHRGDVTALAAADALACFGWTRREALWWAEAAPLCETLEEAEPMPALPVEGALGRAVQDLAATSTTLGPHPAALMRSEMWSYEWPRERLLLARELESRSAGQIVDVFGMVLLRQAPPAANGMVFMTLEDETGFLNLAFTPEVYARSRPLLERRAFLCVRGRLSRIQESHSLAVLMVHGDLRPPMAPVLPMGERSPLEGLGATSVRAPSWGGAR